MTITSHRFFLSDFVSIQRNSFLYFLEKGLIEEISKRNPITNTSNTLEVFFYADYYQLTAPKYNARQAIAHSKSYASRIYIPVQLTDKEARIIKLKWVYLGDLPIMTKRGHFIINGAARVIVNQIIRSPGIYYQTKIYENFPNKWSQKADSSFDRHYADLICQRGTWLRLEVDKDKKIWAQTKKGPKIPIMWFLLAMGLTEKRILQSVLDPNRLLYTMYDIEEFSNLIDFGVNTSYLQKDSNNKVNSSPEIDSAEKANPKLPQYIKTPTEAWAKIYQLFTKTKKAKPIAKGNGEKKTKKVGSWPVSATPEAQNPLILEKTSANTFSEKRMSLFGSKPSQAKVIYEEQQSSSSAPQQGETSTIVPSKGNRKTGLKKSQPITGAGNDILMFAELGRELIFNKFMNPRTYDLSIHGRLNFNKKLNLSISSNQTTLTPQDVLAATNYLLKVEYGLKKVDDIDHLKNRRVRTSGELIQIQFATGLLRLEKSIKEKMMIVDKSRLTLLSGSQKPYTSTQVKDKKELDRNGPIEALSKRGVPNHSTKIKSAFLENSGSYQTKKGLQLTINSLIPNTKAVNSALREFFGTSPLSQFMDQINPLAELTHKRRLSSMGPGGVTRDSATLDIRGIHPSHYGRICPVETPEGKNTGLVNSLTTYARVNKQGYIETPFYKVYKGQVQKKTGIYFFSADNEEKIKLGAADLFASDIGFLSNANIPVRIEEVFSKISRNIVQYVGISPSQMVSIATSLIPFLEHDDANRALMGSNMQRQAVPILKPERPIVGTGLEARVVSDSGHALQTDSCGLITYVSSEKIIIYKQLKN